MKITRFLAAACFGLGLFLGPVEAQYANQNLANTTTVNSTIAVTNTFQTALGTANAISRKSCLLQNTGTHTEYVYFGTLANATTSNAFQVSPGQTISCATVNGVILSDAVNITGTAGDGYIVTSQ